MSGFTVPIRPMAVEIAILDGGLLNGQVFVAPGAATHEGPMRLDEWINDEATFFPFVADEDGARFLLNKARVLSVSFSGPPLRPPIAESRHQVLVEYGGRSVEGVVDIALPPDRSRVLDLLNGPGRFFLVRDGTRSHLVRKDAVSRVTDRGPVS